MNVTNAWFDATKAFAKRMRQYFHAYGGWQAVLNSPLFWLSAFVTGISYSISLNREWVSLTQATIPSLLGFSLGTYTILFSLMTSRLKRALKVLKNSRGVTLLSEVNATFFHFIFVQVLALTWATIYAGSFMADAASFFSHTYPLALDFLGSIAIVGSFLGTLLLVYSIMLILGAALAVYRLALITDPADN